MTEPLAAADVALLCALIAGDAGVGLSVPQLNYQLPQGRSTGGIYRDLERLRVAGYVSRYRPSRRAARRYRVTDQGRGAAGLVRS